MPIIALTEHETATLEGTAPLLIEASPAPGFTTAVRLELEGDVRANPAGASAMQLMTGSGLVRIVVKPLSGEEFGPGTTVSVTATRGRPNTPQQSGVEFEPATLDGRSATVIGTLSFEGDRIIVEAVSGAARGETPLDGVAAAFRAGLRARINREQLSGLAQPGYATDLSIDSSASLSALATPEEVELAANIFIGVAGALNPDEPYEVRSDSESGGSRRCAREELREIVREAYDSGANRIGSGATRSPGAPGRPTFAISDEEPFSCAAHGLTIVVGSGVRDGRRCGIDTPGVLRVTDELRTAIDTDSSDMEEVYDHILQSLVEPATEPGTGPSTGPGTAPSAESIW